MSAAKFCPHCGRPVTPGDVFCEWCGKPLPAPAAPPAAVSAPPPIAYPPPAAYAARRADFGSIFSGTFSTWWKNVVQYFGVYALLTLFTSTLSTLGAVLFLGVPFTPTGSGAINVTPFLSTSSLAAYLAWIVVIAVIGLIAGSVVIGGVTDFAVRRHRGESPRLMESLRRGFGRFPSILGANIATTAITIGLVLIPVAFLLVGIFSIVSKGPSTVPSGSLLALLCGSCLLMPVTGILALYLALALLVNAPAIMMEGAGAIDGLKRSWDLTRGHKWSLLGVVIVLGLISAAVEFAFTPLLAAFPGPFVSIPVAVAIAGLTGSWTTVLAAVAYDLIVRESSFFLTAPTYVPPAPYRP